MAVEDPVSVFFALVAIAAAIYFVRWWTHPLYSIPTMGGPSAPGFSYLAASNFMRHPKEIIDEGYHRFQGSAFKVATYDKWLVVVSGPKMIDELRRRPDEELSFLEGIQDTIQMKYTLGQATMDNPYHIDVIKEKLTRTLPSVLPEVIDELKVAVQKHIKAGEEEWVSANVMSTMQQIVARASNRAFVGLPLCRNQGFLNLAITFAVDVMNDSRRINRVPLFLKPIVGLMISKTKRSVAAALEYLTPQLKERKSMMAEDGEDWDERPNDMFQWLLDEATQRNLGDHDVAQRILLINFAAIHTSSTSITHVLYDLAARPEYLPSLREEIEAVVAEEGWTKAAMAKMWKLDSFLKECQRYNGIGLTSMTRKAMQNLTLNDGTFIPKGTIVVAAAHPMHNDEANYVDPGVFDAFRFARLRQKEGESTKHQYVNTSLDYVPFGHGKHACPGRFFAANELKAMLAYIVLNYDMKMGGDGTRPHNFYIGTAVIPSPAGCVLFRKRQSPV